MYVIWKSKIIYYFKFHGSDIVIGNLLNNKIIRFSYFNTQLSSLELKLFATRLKRVWWQMMKEVSAFMLAFCLFVFFLFFFQSFIFPWDPDICNFCAKHNLQDSGLSLQVYALWKFFHSTYGSASLFLNSHKDCDSLGPIALRLFRNDILWL